MKNLTESYLAQQYDIPSLPAADNSQAFVGEESDNDYQIRKTSPHNEEILALKILA